MTRRVKSNKVVYFQFRLSASVSPHLMRGLAFVRSAARQYGPDGGRLPGLYFGNPQLRDLWIDSFSGGAAEGWPSPVSSTGRRGVACLTVLAVRGGLVCPQCVVSGQSAFEIGYREAAIWPRLSAPRAYSPNRQSRPDNGMQGQ